MTTDVSRNPFPQFNPFRPFVLNELKRRKNDIYTTISSPFVKMTSCMEDNVQNYRFLTLGLHGLNTRLENIFDAIYGTTKDVVGYARRTSDNSITLIDSAQTSESTSITNVSTDLIQQRAQEQVALATSTARAARPIPGITNFQVTRRGLGQPIVASVSWKCYNKGQLEFLRNHFLTPGSYVIIEFGNMLSNTTDFNKTLDFSNKDEIMNFIRRSIGFVNPSELTDTSLYGREYVIKEYIEPNNGNYDVLVAQVGNFKIEMEPESGIFSCTTELVSQGENIWGVSLYDTFANQTLDNPVTGEITTLRDYFEQDMFKVFLQRELKTDDNIAQINTGTNQRATQSSNSMDQANTQNSSVDRLFITWNYFFTNVIQDMLNVIKNDQIRSQLELFLRFDDMDLVGYHPKLRSTDPDTLLIFNYALHKNVETPIKSTSMFTFFSEENISTGNIKNGVWLNANAIYETFLNATNFVQGLHILLSRVNLAVANYWQLQLFFDEAKNAYRIIDYKSGNSVKNHVYYKFNNGATGECLNVEFDSAFPPELITQMMLVAQFNTMDYASQKKLIQDYPLLGSTSAHMFVLNYTDLKDLVKSEIKTWNSSKNIPASSYTQSNPSAEGSATNNTDLSRVTQKLRIGTTQTTPDSGQPIGKPFSNANALSPVPPIPIFKGVITQNKDNLILDEINASSYLKTALYIESQGVVYATSKLSSARGIFQFTYGTWNAYSPYKLPSSAAGNYISEDDPRYDVQKSYDAMKKLTADNIRVAKTAKAPEEIQDVDIYLMNVLGPRAGSQLIKNRNSDEIINDDIKPLLKNNLVIFKQVNVSWKTAYNNASSSWRSYTGKQVTQFNYSKNSLDAIRRGQPDVQVTRGTIPPDVAEARKEIQQKKIENRTREIVDKYGNSLSAFIAINPSDMRNEILRDAYANIDKDIQNNYVLPYPTTTAVTVKILGISGISISDGFFVDKLPFIFDKYGCFQVIEVTDTATQEEGWTTSIKGYYKLLSYTGNTLPSSTY